MQHRLVTDRDVIADDERFIELLSRVNVLEKELLRQSTEYRAAIERKVKEALEKGQSGADVNLQITGQVMDQMVAAVLQ